ncbi:MAG: glycine oxidase ThiO [Planctomycetota bacterium]
MNRVDRTSYDVAVVGGGAIGLASAFRLADGKRSVVVLDAGELGKEASWAGGGILSPVHPYAYPNALTRLVTASTELYPALAEELLDVTQVSIELRRTGLLRLAVDPVDDHDVERAARFRQDHELPTERLASVASFGSALATDARAALYEPDIAQIRNPRLLKALIQGCAKRGVHLAPHEPVLELRRERDRITGVRTTHRTIVAGETVLAAGAWSGELARRALDLDLGVSPVRGQMLLIEGLSGALDTMVLGAGGKYLIPRSDGRILVGSTLEHVGFDRRPTLEGIQALLAAALRLAPGLARGHLARAWAGLRPSTPDRLPFLGRPLGVSGLVLATGHYRNGLVLTPITARIVQDLVEGREPSIETSHFAPNRKFEKPASD